VVYIGEVRVNGSGSRHEDVEAVRWWQPSTSLRGEVSRSGLVKWVIMNGGIVRVVDEDGADVEVRVVDGDPLHIRAWSEAGWTDHLLGLPRY
jgi:hypothetical protein